MHILTELLIGIVQPLNSYAISIREVVGRYRSSMNQYPGPYPLHTRIKPLDRQPLAINLYHVLERSFDGRERPNGREID